MQVFIFHAVLLPRPFTYLPGPQAQLFTRCPLHPRYAPRRNHSFLAFPRLELCTYVRGIVALRAREHQRGNKVDKGLSLPARETSRETNMSAINTMGGSVSGIS